MTDKKIAKIIILAGQSNAVGVGYYEYLPEHFSAQKTKELLSGYKNVRINFYSHDIKSDGFVATTIKLAERTKETFGPELGIAEKLNEDFNGEKFFIVKYAVGGTTLYHDWLSPSSRIAEGVKSEGENDYGYCYDGFVSLLKNSISILEKQGYSSQIRAFCWMQGESDACDEQTVKAYEKRFNDLITDFEKEFKPYLYNYVLADGGISSMWQYYKEMNGFKKRYAESRQNGVFIDTVGAGLTTDREPVGCPDTPHYDSDSVIKLGNLFEQAIKENLK